jgi:hypothetical protein
MNKPTTDKPMMIGQEPLLFGRMLARQKARQDRSIRSWWRKFRAMGGVTKSMLPEGECETFKVGQEDRP